MRPRLPSILVCAALWLAAAPQALAATIQLTILAQPRLTLDALEVHLDVRNNGDAAARNLMPIAVLRGQESLGTFVPALDPGRSTLQTVRIPLSAPEKMKGVWPLFVRLSYGDANNHPFEALHVTGVPFGGASAFPDGAGAPVTVELSGGRVATRGEITARLRSTIDVGAAITFIVPAGLAVAPDQASVFLNPGTRGITAFVSNAGATVASRLPVFAVVEYDAGGEHATAIASAVVEIAEAHAASRRWFFAVGLAALVAVWAVLAFARRRSPGAPA